MIHLTKESIFNQSAEITTLMSTYTEKWTNAGDDWTLTSVIQLWASDLGLVLVWRFTSCSSRLLLCSSEFSLVFSFLFLNSTTVSVHTSNYLYTNVNMVNIVPSVSQAACQYIQISSSLMWLECHCNYCMTNMPSNMKYWPVYGKFISPTGEWIRHFTVLQQ